MDLLSSVLVRKAKVFEGRQIILHRWYLKIVELKKNERTRRIGNPALFRSMSSKYIIDK